MSTAEVYKSQALEAKLQQLTDLTVNMLGNYVDDRAGKAEADPLQVPLIPPDMMPHAAIACRSIEILAERLGPCWTDITIEQPDGSKDVYWQGKATGNHVFLNPIPIYAHERHTKSAEGESIDLALHLTMPEALVTALAERDSTDANKLAHGAYNEATQEFTQKTKMGKFARFMAGIMSPRDADQPRHQRIIR